ncbi:MAG: filamentous hemagglutinin N-terminal domain-containing protein, partial [Gammaproteobacteria bacterium]|nr:filamentous hemagglutinin N-terminal domain-containing protein [Gammaproteobacteria bacterium]
LAVFNKKAAPVVKSSLVGAFHQKLLQTLPQNRWVQRRLAFSGTALSVCITLAGFSLPTLFNPVQAAPSGGKVVGGTGTISKDDLETIIKQTSQNMAIDWDSYNIDATEVVKYIQPNGKSISLNRILGVNGSTIAGRIESNGQVILVNPNGLVFTESAVLNVGGIIASGLNMNTSDFMNGDYIFDEVVGSEGTVINRGIINASIGGNKVGGNVALIGKQVENSGLISANLGSVTLAAGKQAVMTFETGGLLGVRVSKEILQEELGLDAAVVNSGEINAKGGRVLLTASASRDIFSQAVKGLDEATSAVVHEDGSFTLGGGADLVNSGSVDVSSSEYGQSAGQVVVLAENITHSGQVVADANNSTGGGLGGDVELHAMDTTLLTESSVISASASESGKAGIVKVLGDKVGLFDQATVDASGGNGGEIYIGGGIQGKNDQLRNASFTYVGEETRVSADGIATQNSEPEVGNSGDAGTVITFSNDTTRIYGELSATGGTVQGDGGFV